MIEPPRSTRVFRSAAAPYGLCARRGICVGHPQLRAPVFVLVTAPAEAPYSPRRPGVCAIIRHLLQSAPPRPHRQQIVDRRSASAPFRKRLGTQILRLRASARVTTSKDNLRILKLGPAAGWKIDDRSPFAPGQSGGSGSPACTGSVGQGISRPSNCLVSPLGTTESIAAATSSRLRPSSGPGNTTNERAILIMRTPC
jgi:hypothetical protein